MAEGKTMTQHLGSGAKYSGVSVLLGSVITTMLAETIPELKSNPELVTYIQSGITFGINLLTVWIVKS